MIPDMLKEFDQFIEIKGKMYCTLDTCEGCQYKDKCQNTSEEVYIDTIPPARAIIKTDNTPDSYSLETDSVENKNLFKQGRFLDPNGTIPHNNKRVYKIIKDIKNIPYKNREINHILFQDGNYYCIKQRCSNCKYQDICQRTFEVKSFKDYIEALDIVAQEPNSFLLSTKMTGNTEKVWLETFANSKIRQLKEWHTLKTLFKHNNIDTSINNEAFQLWLDKSFFYDFTDIFKLQVAVNKYYKDKNEDTIAELETITNRLLDSYKEFENKVTQ